MTLVTAVLLVLPGMFALVLAAPPASAAKACPGQAAASTIVDPPWPQRRYDLAGLSQITNGAGVTVAVVDSGVDATNPQLAGLVTEGADLLDPGGDGRRDCVGHGTAVASIIAAQARSGAGLRGLAPGARIYPVRVSERIETNGTVSGDGSLADLAAGVAAAVASHPRPAVINLSISTTTDDPALRHAVQSALAADIVVVAAVGNQHDRGDPTPYPASYPGVLGVGGVGPDGTRVPSSQIGSYVDLVAPGDGVVGAAPRAGHRALQGTSFAAPFVAATATLIRARWPSLSAGEVVHRLLATADPTPGSRPSAEYGYGILNPMRALTEVVAPLTQPDATSPAPARIGSPRAERVLAGPAAGTVLVSVALIVAAATIAGFAAAVPAARRRRWRPGPAQPGRSAQPEPAELSGRAAPAPTGQRRRG